MLSNRDTRGYALTPLLFITKSDSKATVLIGSLLISFVSTNDPNKIYMRKQKNNAGPILNHLVKNPG